MPADTSYGPAVVVAVIPELAEHGVPGAYGHVIRPARAFHVAESHKRRDHWSNPKYYCFNDGVELHDWLEIDTSPHRRVHVFTPNVTMTLTLSRFWDRIEGRGCFLEGKELSGQRGESVPPADALPLATSFNSATLPTDESIGPFEFSCIVSSLVTEIVRYRVNDHGILWTTFGQYVDTDESKIAAALNYAGTRPGDLSTALPNVERSPRDRALMWCHFFSKLSTWWVKHDGGPWGTTIAGCAYAYLRRRLKPKSVLRHNDGRAGSLEERAIIGGRRSIWYVGNIGTEADWEPFAANAPARSFHGDVPAGLHHHDVRSMYPFLLSRLDYPVRLVTVKAGFTPAAALDYLQTYGLIAQVVLKTDHPEYPFRTGRGVSFPLGRFQTTLCGPELGAAISSGAVERIGLTAVYAMGRPFAATADEMLALREKYRDDEEPGWEMFAKALANSMSGRLALKQHEWTPRPNVAAKESWGTFTRRNLDTGEARHYRSRAGMVWEQTLAKVKCRPMGAAYAYLTSYGRWMMMFVRAQCPPRTVVAQDTDGIWTLPAASVELYRFGDPESRESGHLHRDHETPCGRFFGPQHYWWGRAWVLSGHARPRIRPGTTVVDITERTMPLLDSHRHTPEPYCFERDDVREIGRIQTTTNIDADGWIIPPVETLGPQEAFDQ